MHARADVRIPMVHHVRWVGFSHLCEKFYTCIVKCTSDGLQTRIVKKMHSKDYKNNSTGASAVHFVIHFALNPSRRASAL